MRIFALVVSWAAVAFGAFGILSGMPTNQYYADYDLLMGGALFLLVGIPNLMNIYKGEN